VRADAVEPRRDVAVRGAVVVRRRDKVPNAELIARDRDIKSEKHMERVGEVIRKFQDAPVASEMF
jgi:hypothetical protein